MSKTYSAGIVTAYGAAKRAGYQGTYEDFCRQQAGYAGNAAAVEAAKTAAQTAANTATAKAGEAITAATDAQTAKIQTEQAASQALTDISTARSDAIIAVQTEGATQTANARAQAQAAAQSATTAITKASEASASATSAGQSATNAAASATSAAQSASDAQDVLDSIPADYSDLSNDVGQLKANLGDLKDTTTEENIALYTTATQDGANYWQIRSPQPQLVAGTKYRVTFVTNASFTETSIQLGTSGSSVSMVDTLGTNIEFVANTPQTFDYTPSQNGLKYIRLLGNAAKYSSIVFYTHSVNLKGIPQINEDIDTLRSNAESAANGTALAVKTNKAIKELRSLKNSVDESVSSLLQVQSESGTTQTITIPSVGVHEKYLLRLGLHYESSKYTPQADDIFFDKSCRKDFTDVRFLDSSGNIIKAELGELINCDILADPNVDKLLKVTSNGYIVGFNGGAGIVISRDNGVTYTAIPNTYNVTANGSDVYNRKSMYPVFVDSNDNIYAYAGGTLFKLLASDDYTTITPVLDFSWVNSNNVRVYPEIQNHGMDEDINGNLIMGTYAKASYWHTDVFVSTDGGDTWNLAYHNYDGSYQHVHHVHADRYSSKVYVGIDDGGTTLQGSKILVTDDGGATFANIADQIIDTRGKDYYPTYFGNGYRLGGGETYVMGGATIFRSEDDIRLERAVKGYAGVRSFADFGTDDLIIAGSQASSLVNENHIFVSYDKGKTWKSVYKKYQTPSVTSGIGYRDIHGAFTLAGDTEPCVLMPKDSGSVPSVRVYHGGDHYYREAYLYLENTTNNPIEITVKTGYMMGYPYKCIEENSDSGMLYNLPLNEGIGNTVIDSDGNVAKINGTYDWWHKDEPCRYGDYAGESTLNHHVPSTGLKVGKYSTINLGKIDKLSFSKGYTISFWFNFDNLFMDADLWNVKTGEVVNLFDIGNVKAAFRSVSMMLLDNTANIQHYMGSLSGIARMGMALNNVPFRTSDDWNHCVMSVDTNNVCTVYVNGSVGASQSASAGTWANLSTGDLVIGAEGFEGAYLADIKIFNYAMTADQALNEYRGLN